MSKKTQPKTTVTTGPLLNKDGTVAVDAARFPSLHRALSRISNEQREGWTRVAAMRRAGDLDSADRLARKLLGVQGPPMSEETKAKLREYNETHKEEIQERRRQESEVRRRTLDILTPKGKAEKQVRRKA